MLSVLIVHRNDSYITLAVESLLRGTDSTQFEIVIYDDCSDEPITLDLIKYPNVRIIQGRIQRGVGYGFDRLVEHAKYDTIVLTASDVIVKDSSWIDKVNDYVSMFPNSMGCSCCIELDPEHLDPNNPKEGNIKRYGAQIVIYATNEYVSLDYPLLKDKTPYVGLFDNKWIKFKPEEEVSEIPALYGAFYTTTKTWYQYIRGFDTDPSIKLSGHCFWGGLENWISIKSWLAGGSVHCISTLETGHVFHKHTIEDGVVLNGHGEMFWKNKFFIAFTMLRRAEAQRLMDKVMTMLIALELKVKNASEGRRLIKYYMPYVLEIRERNKLLFTRDINWLCKKFNIRKDC